MFQGFESNWFALQVRAKTEHRVSEMLCSKGYEGFLPTSTHKRGRPERMCPLFPGYIFCRINPDAQGLIVTTPGVIRILGFGGRPVPIDPEEVRSIQLLMDSGAPMCSLNGLHPGDKVRVIEGPLRGAVGTVASVRTQHRLVISIAMMMRTVVAEVQPEWISAVAPLAKARYAAA
jgi:transcription antitermination factor NusG